MLTFFEYVQETTPFLSHIHTHTPTFTHPPILSNTIFLKHIRDKRARLTISFLWHRDERCVVSPKVIALDPLDRPHVPQQEVVQHAAGHKRSIRLHYYRKPYKINTLRTSSHFCHHV